MRYPNTFQQLSKLLFGSVLCSLMLLLGACAELSLNTPTPASNGNAQAAAAATAQAPTSVQFAAPPPTATAAPTATSAPTMTPVPLSPGATAAPTATITATAIPTATTTAVPPMATRVPPTATKVPPTVKVVPTTSLAGSKGDDQDLTFVAVNGNVPGKDASVTVQTVPGRGCSIGYVTPNGQASTAKGLEAKTSDLDGRITWKWTIGTSTKAGKGTVKVTCGDASESRPITIG